MSHSTKQELKLLKNSIKMTPNFILLNDAVKSVEKELS